METYGMASWAVYVWARKEKKEVKRKKRGKKTTPSGGYKSIYEWVCCCCKVMSWYKQEEGGLEGRSLLVPFPRNRGGRWRSKNQKNEGQGSMRNNKPTEVTDWLSKKKKGKKKKKKKRRAKEEGDVRFFAVLFTVYFSLLPLWFSSLCNEGCS
jgi:hypothetical protein